MTASHQPSTTEQEKGIRRPPVLKDVRSNLALRVAQANPLLLQRLIARPESASPDGILTLQRTVGNRATTHLIQAKVRVGPTGDRYEREADRVAAQVMHFPAPEGGQTAQRQGTEEEELQAKPLASSITPLVQRQEEEEELQAKPLVQRQAGGGFQASGAFEQRLAAQRSNGSPLPDKTRAFMEPRFGADFSGVCVHTNSESAQLNREINAQAFTHGQDIYLGADKYQPETDDGKQ
ncbi:MAG: DUF4157 domain-containing protein, partial [Chloroflexota bacterium]|nr:DUF4157 domain-containing protein [Chloroflexota bacterium]